MGLRDDFLRKITKKQAEIAEMEANLRAEKRYLEALQDGYKLLPKDGVVDADTVLNLRKGSGTSKAYDALKRHGRPMHVNAIAAAIGKKPSRQNTQSLASSMRSYVLKGEIFTKPAPNTYGLVEWGDSGNVIDDGPPPPVDDEPAAPDIFEVVSRKAGA